MKLIVLFGILIALTPFAIDMYIPAMPTMAVHFNTGLATMQFSLGIYLLGLCIGQLIYGPIADAIGRKPILLMGLTIFSIASIFCSFTTSDSFFLCFRFMQALGGAAVVVAVNAMVTDHYKGAEGVKVRATIIVIMTIAPMLSPLIGGWLLLHFGWQCIFYFLSFYAILLITLCVLLLQESIDKTKPLNISHMFDSYRDLLSQKNIWLWLTALGFNSGVNFSFIVGSPYLYLSLFDISPQDFGWYFSVNLLSMMIFASINTRVSSYFGIVSVMRFGQFIQASALVLLLFFWSFELLDLLILIPAFALAFGINTFINPNASSLMLELYQKRAGTASALLGTFRYGFAVIFSGVVSLGSELNLGVGAIIWPMVFASLSSIVLLNIVVRRTEK